MLPEGKRENIDEELREQDSTPNFTLPGQGCPDRSLFPQAYSLGEQKLEDRKGKIQGIDKSRLSE